MRTPAQNYDYACHRAAQRQGLAEPWRILECRGIVTFLEQTGGFCMALRIPCAAGPGKNILVTVDDEWDEYMCGLYDDDGDELLIRNATADELVATVWAWSPMHHFLPPDPEDALTFDECEAAGVDGCGRSPAAMGWRWG